MERYEPHDASGLLAITLSGIALAATCQKPDPTTMVKTMTDMFAALTVDDGGKLAAIFTPDGVEFDGGERFTGRTLWDLIKTLHAKGIRLVWTVRDTDVHFACGTAWIDHIDCGTVFDGKTTMPGTWLESAALANGKKGWPIRFLHLTQVPAPQPAKYYTCGRFAPISAFSGLKGHT